MNELFEDERTELESQRLNIEKEKIFVETEKLRQEEKRAQQDIEIINHKTKHENNIEGYRSTLQFGKGALKSAYILNGGAAFAWLAFLGTIIRSDIGKFHFELSDPIFYFSVGILLVTIAHGTSYFAQVHFQITRQAKPKNAWYIFNYLMAELWRVSSALLIIFSYEKFYNGLKIAREIILLIK